MAENLIQRTRRIIREYSDDMADIFLATMVAEVAPYSKTLAETFYRTPLMPTALGFRFGIESPYFWANIIDKGRPPVGAVNARALIYFKNPLEDDPRLQGGYHRTERDARSTKLSMSWSELREMQLEGRAFVVPRGSEVRAVAATNYVREARAIFRKDASSILKRRIRASLLTGVGEFAGDYRFQVTF